MKLRALMLRLHESAASWVATVCKRIAAFLKKLMTNFPTALDMFNNPTAATPMSAAGYEHDLQHAGLNDAVKALEAKVGVNNSTVTTSLDYRIRQLEQGGGGGAVISVNGLTGAVTLTTGNITEGTNLYFTNARVRAAVSVSAPLNYNATTGVFSLTPASASADGYLSHTDWNAFNNKQNALGFTPLDAAGSNAMMATLNLAPPVNASAVHVSGYSLTGSNAAALLDLVGTWNTSGRPTAIKLNVTDITSDLHSALIDLQVNGSTVFKVDKRSVVSATYYNNAQQQLVMSGDSGNLYLFYPATSHHAIIADDSSQTLSWHETGSDQVRAQVTAYSDFIFYDSVNGNQPCFIVRGDGSAISTNGGSVVFGASGNTFWFANNEEIIGLQVDSLESCAIQFNLGNGTTLGFLGVRTSGLFLHANNNLPINFEVDNGNGYIDANGNFFVSGGILDSSGNPGNSGDVLTATVTGTAWQSCAPSIRSLFDMFGAGSTGTAETALMQYNLNGGTLANEGEKFIGEYTGTFAHSTSQKRLKFYFGQALIFDTGALTVSAASTWTVSVIIMSTPPFQAVVCLVKAVITGTSPGIYAANIIFQTNLGQGQNLKLTGTASGSGVADNDIQALFGTGWWQTGQFVS